MADETKPAAAEANEKPAAKRKAAKSVATDENPFDPVKVDLAKYEAELPPEPEEHEYYVGVTKKTPFHVIYVGGQDFPRVEEDVEVLDDGTTNRTKRIGKRVFLSDEKVALIKEHVALQIVRKRGDSWSLYSRKDRRYRAVPGDRSLGEFIFMIPVKEQMPPNWDKVEHEPLVTPSE